MAARITRTLTGLLELIPLGSAQCIRSARAHLLNWTRIGKLRKSFFVFCDIMSHITPLSAQSGMMPDPPDIEKLRRRRDYHDSLNVQQQTALTQSDIRREASWWRSNPITPAILAALSQRGFDVDTGILIDVCDRELGGDDCADGTFITNAERFIEFSIELSLDGTELIAIHECRDVTESLEICGTKPGIGATRPFLALEVLRELNGGAGG